MKKLFITITLIAVMVVTAKRVKEKRSTIEMNFTNKDELESLIEDIRHHATSFDECLKAIKNFKPDLR